MFPSRSKFVIRAGLFAPADVFGPLRPLAAPPGVERRSAFQPSLSGTWLNRRGVVVAAIGIACGALSQASLVEASRGRLQSEVSLNYASVASSAANVDTEVCAKGLRRPQYPPATPAHCCSQADVQTAQNWTQGRLPVIGPGGE
jgi:hypothetical protein